METTKSTNWKLLCEAPNKLEAVFIQGRLQAEGISVHIVSEAVAELYGITHGALAAVKIYVPQQQLEAARAVLAQQPPPPPEDGITP